MTGAPDPVPAPADDAATDEHPATSEEVMGMLQGHVPLSLLVDISTPDGPSSVEILTEEGGPVEPWWQQ